MARASATAHWRDSARPVKFFFIDSSAAYPFLLFLMHIKWWTFYTCLGIVLFLAILIRFGFSLPVFARWLRLQCAGKRKISRPWWG